MKIDRVILATNEQELYTQFWISSPAMMSIEKNFEIFSAQEFIAAITQHIPDKHFQMVRYYG
jgi:hypothetical protein